VIVIRSNGSGGIPLPLSALLDRLQTDKLDDYFGDCCGLAHACQPLGRGEYAYLGPIYPEAPDAVQFFGNFETWSHVFCVETDDAEVIEVLTDAIAANRARFGASS
jgi:hypothetical protein